MASPLSNTDPPTLIFAARSRNGWLDKSISEALLRDIYQATVIIDQFVISAALSSFDWQSQKLARF